MSVHRPLSLLLSRRFGWLFATQFLGAGNDNLFKNALVILLVYRAGEGAVSPALMGTLAAGLFILPFFLFSAVAGQLADRHDKAVMMRLVKLAEIVLMSLAAFGFVTNMLGLCLVVLFGMGVHSAFFGPLKYAVLPDYLPHDDLVGGNALIEGGTFLAILLGTISGGLMVLTEHGPIIVSLAIIVVAVLGWMTSLRLPAAPPVNPGPAPGWNLFGETATILRRARQNREVFLSILGISWFWLVGSTYLSQFPAYAKEVLGVDNHVVTLFLTLFSIGIGAGSLLCSRLLRGEISARHVPFAALALTVFTADFAFASWEWQPAAPLQGVAEFMARPGAWRILVDLILVSVFGGIYAVPLYTILQDRAEAGFRARAIAANNIMNAAFMTGGAIITGLLLSVGTPIPGLFLVLAAANGLVAVIICGLLPDTVLKALLARLLRLAFRVDITGLDHVKALGERSLIIANHVSLLDAALLAVFLPGRLTFAINTQVAGRWWVAPFLKIVDAIPLDPTNPMAIKALTRAVEQGRRVVIFPEGRITVTGALMKVYDGPGMIADRARAQVLPVHIDGAQYSLFSYLRGKVRRRLFPRIRLNVLSPTGLTLPENLKGRARRRAAGERLYGMLSSMQFATSPYNRTIPDALLDMMTIQGGGHVALEDMDRKPLTLRRIVLGALVLGRKLAGLTSPGENVAVLLPNAAGTAVTILALQMFGRVPAMLNFTAGLANLTSACQTANVNLLLTSKRFVDAARLSETIAGLPPHVRVVYLEDMRQGIGRLDRLRGLLSLPFARRLHARHSAGAEAAAVVLFTSGSEGKPKGVVLPHRAILANCYQVAARIDVTAADMVFNALPLFHAFGLTGGLVLPLLGGARVFLYPSPLHYRIVSEMVYDIGATILFGTDTFLAGYARVAHPYDFHSVRYVVAGAEKVKDETRRVWMDKFGLRLMEGYGATETAPVLAVNTPTHFRAGTVGRLLPGIDWRLEPVPGIEEGGRLWVSGPNVMLGYLKADRPGEVQPPADGWYDSGDIVTLDDQGFVQIQGRAKRFAKVAGEMVSLGLVEEQAEALWPGFQHAVLAQADERKGERLVLLTTFPGANRPVLADFMRGRGCSELAVPRLVQVRDKLPLLGTGKVDYLTLAAETDIR